MAHTDAISTKATSAKKIRKFATSMTHSIWPTVYGSRLVTENSHCTEVWVLSQPNRAFVTMIHTTPQSRYAAPVILNAAASFAAASRRPPFFVHSWMSCAPVCASDANTGAAITAHSRVSSKLNRVW